VTRQDRITLYDNLYARVMVRHRLHPLSVKFQQMYVPKVSQARDSGIVGRPLDADPLDSLLCK